MDILESVAEIQVERTDQLLLMGLVLTAVLATGIPDIRLQTDFQESLPTFHPWRLRKESRTVSGVLTP